MKNIIVVLLGLFTQFAHAECTERQSNEKMEPKIEYVRGNVFVGGGRPKIDTVHFSVPLKFEGMLLKQVVISDGGILEVPKFRIPVAFSIENGFAKAKIKVDLEAIEDINVSFDYRGSECNAAFSKLLGG